MKIASLTVLLVFSIQASGQLVGTGVSSNSQPVRRMEVYSWAQRPDEDGTDLQKKFLKQEWTPGTVKFKSGRAAMDVPLLFDIYDNTLYYLQDSVIMEFVDPVLDVTFHTTFNKDTVNILFRRFFPDIQANTAATFYRVLVDAPVSLLKCQAKSILLFKDPATPEEKKKDPPEHLYFTHLPDGTITVVEPNIEKLQKALPAYSNTILEITKSEKLKIKDEGRLVSLFIHLNNKMQ